MLPILRVKSHRSWLPRFPTSRTRLVKRKDGLAIVAFLELDKTAAKWGAH